MTRQEITIKVAKNAEFFAEQGRAFADRVEGYAERLIERCEQRRAELKNELGENAFVVLNPRADRWRTLAGFLDTYEKHAGDPPEPGWVWDDNDACCRYLDWDVVHRVWCPHYRPPDDENPLLWFIAADEIRPGAYVSPGRHVPDDDRLLHDAILLAIAHDCAPEMSGADPRVFATVPRVRYWPREEFFRKVDNAINLDGGDTRLEKAWDRVKSELDRRTHDTPNGPEPVSENARAAPRRGSASETEPARDGVFISYSHKDKKWFRELQDHLKPYTRKEPVTFWSDEAISPGQQWFAQIKAALASTKVAVLLVTKDFLASEFIAEHELRPLLEQARRGNVQIIWIPLGACSYKESELKSLQAPIDPDKPLAKMKKQDRDEAWVKICEAIKEAVTR